MSDSEGSGIRVMSVRSARQAKGRVAVYVLRCTTRKASESGSSEIVNTVGW
jgi:hypothetical protein